jgi:23S rRNA (cytidine1920-2'-O)/16S rRNA (cytidine1409-2'-O)-methyltransferase
MSPARRAHHRVRLDIELVRRGLAPSRAEAQRLIETGRVRVRGALASKAAALVAPGDPVAVAGGPAEYASRGGTKLAGALDALGVDVNGCNCLDVGASTGGFTDVLLRRGAARVVAVDVGYGQLAWSLRTDPRVVVLDRTNARFLTPGLVPPPAPDLVVADLSFISLTLVLPALRSVAAPDADFVLLVKPQFEAGRSRVGKGGVVRDPTVWAEAMRRVIESGAEFGLGLRSAVASPLPGPAGNVEFFLYLQAGEGVNADDAIGTAIARAPIE